MDSLIEHLETRLGLLRRAEMGAELGLLRFVDFQIELQSSLIKQRDTRL